LNESSILSEIKNDESFEVMKEMNREEPKPFLRKVMSKKKKSVFSYE